MLCSQNYLRAAVIENDSTPSGQSAFRIQPCSGKQCLNITVSGILTASCQCLRLTQMFVGPLLIVSLPLDLSEVLFLKTDKAELTYILKLVCLALMVLLAFAFEPSFLGEKNFHSFRVSLLNPSLLLTHQPSCWFCWRLSFAALQVQLLNESALTFLYFVLLACFSYSYYHIVCVCVHFFIFIVDSWIEPLCEWM